MTEKVTFTQVDGGGSSGTISGDADVHITSVADKDLLSYDSGSSKWINRTIAAVSALMSVFVGDSGSGGTKGLVPAPGAGDAAAGKFLKADGTFAVPSTPTTTLATDTDVTITSAANNDFLAYNSGSSKWTNRTTTATTALLDSFVGDSGSGGTKGLVPAPGSGDATAGKFLKADGTFAVPGGGSGAMQLVSTLTASNSASLAWTNLTGSHWKLVGTFLQPATSTAQLEIQYGTGASPTYKTTGYYLGGALNEVTAATGTSNVSETNTGAFIGEAQNNTQQGASFVIDFMTDNATFVHLLGQIIYCRTDGQTMVETIGGIVAITEQLTALKVLENTGNITSGTISLYTIQH